MITIEAYAYDGSDEAKATYEEIRAWDPRWFPPAHWLPKLGAIARLEDGTRAAYICADMSNSVPRATIEFMMTNPAVPKMKRFRAVELIEQFLCERLLELGYTVIIGMSRHAGVAALSQEFGYTVEPHSAALFHKVLV